MSKVAEFELDREIVAALGAGGQYVITVNSGSRSLDVFMASAVQRVQAAGLMVERTEVPDWSQIGRIYVRARYVEGVRERDEATRQGEKAVVDKRIIVCPACGASNIIAGKGYAPCTTCNQYMRV